MKNLFVAAVLLLIVSALSFGQSASSILTITATVSPASLTINTSSNLALGVVAKNSTKTILSSDVGAAAFTISAEKNWTLNVTVAPLTYLTDGSSNHLTFNLETPLYNTSLSQSGAVSTGFTISGGSALTDATTGNLYLWMGGGVTAIADQPAGNYSGTIAINVAYP
jgi:hypothetical protein